MTTENKIVANRNNSQKSTGPKTPIGKKYSSQNPVKHGFFSRKPSLSETEKEEFETLVSQLEKNIYQKRRFSILRSEISLGARGAAESQSC
jgi:hypothetical protein